MANVMSKAWDIARVGKQKFGGSVKSYFAEALRLAWSIIKKGANALRPTNKQVHELVRKTKAARIVANELKKQNEVAPLSYAMGRKMMAAMKEASDYNKELKEMLALFTEEERNAMRDEAKTKGWV